MDIEGCEYKTMYIKFPTVTKLQYPFPEQIERKTSYRNIMSLSNRRQAAFKLDLLSKKQQFNIVELPKKQQIMNICSMKVLERQIKIDKNDQKMQIKKQQVKRQIQQQKSLRKKIFSVSKLTNNKMTTKTQFINPFKIHRSSSNNSIKLVNHCKFDLFQIYPQMMRMLALSYNIVVQSSSRNKRAKVNIGNNGFLVRQVLKKRIWWTLPVNEKGKEDQLSVINLLWSTSAPSEITSKKVIQSTQSCIYKRQQDQQILFQRNIETALNQLPNFKKLFFTQWQQHPKRLKDWFNNLTNNSKNLKLVSDQLTLVNYIPHSEWLTNKKQLYQIMCNYYKDIGIDPHTKIPKTFHLTCFNWQQTLSKIQYDERPWIYKPGQNTNRGNGIIYFASTREAINYSMLHPPKSQNRSYLLQQYISPLLYQSRKFDIRCFMLGVKVGNVLKFYWYQQGYIRTASQKFNLNKPSRSIHLTNDAVQKHMKHYGQHEAANKLSFQQLQKYCLNHTTFRFFQHILPQMKRIARDACTAFAQSSKLIEGGIAFQLFGLDFLIDQSGKPWLLQVNNNPSLQICCNLLSRIIPEMIENTFRIVVDLLMPAKKTPDYAQNFLSNNQYALILKKYF